MAGRAAKAYPPEIYKKVDAFKLFDDTFMSKVFDGRKAETALLLQIILGDPGIKVISVHTQVEIKNLQGRSVRLDIKARDSKGVIFEVEVQRESSGAKPKRARYISSVLDANVLKAAKDFEKLPELYVIFITEHDVIGEGQPIYHVDRIISESGSLFGDKSHIIYVNGEITDDTELGRLMHDFHCIKAGDMNYKLLADRVRYFKETQKGRNAMCAIVEDYANEVAERREKEAVQRANRKAILKGFQGGLTKEMAMTMYPKYTPNDIEELYKKAQKSLLNRKAAK